MLWFFAENPEISFYKTVGHIPKASDRSIKVAMIG